LPIYKINCRLYRTKRKALKCTNKFNLYYVYILYMENIDIVVSRYNEDLKWMNEYPFNKFQYIVYNKGVNENFCKK
jgi:hypothetical protein